MPDTMTLTKTVAALCGAFLAFLLFSWLSETIYHGGHGGKAGHDQAYAVDSGAEAAAEEAAAEEAPAEAAVPFAELLAAADPAAGEKLWRQCQACHKLDGTDGVGPHLNGVVGRGKAAVAGYAYSAALAGMAGDIWSPENLNAFLENPKGYAPGTKMSYNGMRAAEDRANLIAYLAATGG